MPEIPIFIMLAILVFLVCTMPKPFRFIYLVFGCIFKPQKFNLLLKELRQSQDDPAGWALEQLKKMSADLKRMNQDMSETIRDSREFRAKHGIETTEKPC